MCFPYEWLSGYVTCGNCLKTIYMYLYCAAYNMCAVWIVRSYAHDDMAVNLS